MRSGDGFHQVTPYLWSVVGTFARRGQKDARALLPVGERALCFQALSAARSEVLSGKGVNRVEIILAIFVVGVIAIAVMTYIGRTGAGNA